jgi:hypothetical protein
MKIALCLSGQPRSFEKGYEYHKKNLLDHYDVDVFIHTWADSPGLEELFKLYDPVSVMVEQKPVGDFDKRFTNTPNAVVHPPRFTVAMLYSIFKSCELKVAHELTNKFSYDWVIKSRTDYALNIKLPFEKLDNTKLYIPNCRMVPTRDFGNDQFAFGGSDVMNKRMAIYQNMEHFYDQNVAMIGEDMMRAQLHETNLHGENLVYVNMDNPFPPGQFNGTWHSLIRDDCAEWKKQ